MKKKIIAGIIAVSLIVQNSLCLGTVVKASAKNNMITFSEQTEYKDDMTSESDKKEVQKKGVAKENNNYMKTASIVETVPEGYTAIRNIDDLCAIDNDSSGKYILMNDIDLTEATKKGGSYDTGHGWTPLKCFSGVLDGNGYKIKGMHIYGDEISEAGLFANLKDAEIKNLAVVDCDIDIKCKEGENSNKLCAGVIVGYIDYFAHPSRIEKCYTTGKVKVNTLDNNITAYAGGIIGYGGCYIYECYSSATIIGEGASSEVYAIGNNCSNSYLPTYSSRCYFAGNLECDNKFFGYKMVDCYYLNTCYTTESFSGAKPLTQTQMRNKGSFTNWDFENVWYFEPYSNYQYPQLKNLPHVKTSGIEVITMPSKTTYAQGEEVSLEGTTVKLIYDDGYSTLVDASQDFKLEYDNLKLGNQDAILSYNDITAKIPITFTGEEVTDIELSAPSTNIANGNCVLLTAVTKPENALDKKITWSITDKDGNTVSPSIAQVNENGEFNAREIGTYIVTATVRNGVSKSITINVTKPIIYLISDPEEVTINCGETIIINLKKSPLDSTEDIFWKSSNESIATVENGNVKALAPGDVEITAYTNSGVEANCNVKVVKEISECEISGITSQTYTGKEIKLENLQLFDVNGLLEEGCDYTVSYDNNVEVGTATVTINGIGKYRGSLVRNFDIVGKSNDKEQNVTNPIIYLIAEPREIAMNYGETTVINLTKTPLNSNEEIFWKSSNESIATVENGKVTALAPGDVTITVYTTSGVKTNCNVKIVKDISECKISGIASQDYTGEEIELEDLQILDGISLLEEGTDYILIYEDNVEVGTATVTIDGIGKYAGSVSKNFDIVGKTYPKMSKVSLSKWKKISKKSAKVVKYEIKWKKISSIAGYEIALSKFSKNKWYSSKKTTKKTSYIYTASNKKYIKVKIKVRAYRYENGKKVYGGWSKEANTKIEFPKQKAKSYYFAGKYHNSKHGMTLIMNQYSSPEGKEVGNFKLTLGFKIYLDVKGILKKIGTNTYQCKKGKSVFNFKVYENKVVIGMNSKALKDYYDYRGTFKLKKHFYS